MADPAVEDPTAPPDNVYVLRRDDGTLEARDASTMDEKDIAAGVDEAKRRKAVFLYRHDGAQARAGVLGSRLQGALAAGAATLMLEKIIQEELVPTTAKEAMEVAKIAYGIHKEMNGAAPTKDLSATERAQKADDAAALQATLADRAERANANLAGATADDEPIPEPAPEATAQGDDGPGEEPEPLRWEHDVPDDGAD